MNIDPGSILSQTRVPQQAGPANSTPVNAAALAQSLGYQSAPSQATQEQGLAALQALTGGNLAKEVPLPEAQIQQILAAAQQPQVASPAVAVNPARAAAPSTVAAIEPLTEGPFTAIESLLKSIFAPIVPVVEAAGKTFFGIGDEAVQNAVKSGFGTVQAKNLDIRAVLKNLFSTISTSFAGLSQAADQGKLDVPTQKLTELVNKGIKEIPQAFNNIVGEIADSRAFIDSMNRIIDGVQADLKAQNILKNGITFTDPKVVAGLQKVKDLIQQPSAN